MTFYMEYMSRWPESFIAAEAPDGSLMGYMLGKAEGKDKRWHGHVSAVTVAPAYRRLGLAKTLMDDLESTCENVYHTYFVDLFVRASNPLAITMYEKLDILVASEFWGIIVGKIPKMHWICEKPCHEMSIRKVLSPWIIPCDQKTWNGSVL